MEETNLIIEVGNLCLKRAKEMLKDGKISADVCLCEAADAAEIVRKLVECVAMLDNLNLRREEQNRSFAAVYPGRLLERPKAGN